MVGPGLVGYGAVWSGGVWLGRVRSGMVRIIIMAKKIYSSYYAVAKYLPPEIVQIGISIVLPFWWQPPDRRVESRLAPDKSAFRKDNWRELYTEKMSRLAANGILQAICDRIPDGSVILCYERDETQCHRSIALRAMIEFCNVQGQEWEYPARAKTGKKVKPGTEQPTLF